MLCIVVELRGDHYNAGAADAAARAAAGEDRRGCTTGQ